MKRAEMYLRRNLLIVYASSRTTDGVWIGEGPYITVDAGVSTSEKGKVVLDALGRSRSSVPHPTTWTGVEAELFRAAGVRNWATFVKQAKGATVEQDATGEIVLIPLKNMGPDDGFVETDGKPIVVVNPLSAHEVGECVERVLSMAQ